MEMPRRVYRGGKQVGYYVDPREYEQEDDGVRIHMTAVITICNDHYAGNCRVCGAVLPNGVERTVCLNCLSEQCSLALVEAANNGDLLEYLTWKQQRQQADRHPTAAEWTALAEAQGVERMVTTGHPPGSRGREDDYYQVKEDAI